MTGESLRLAVDIDYLRDQLATLFEIPSPTGYTDTIVRHVCGEIERLGLGFDLTRRGAIRACLPGRDRAGARAVVSHLDTLGAQVRSLKANGRLGLVPVGTWSARFAEGARTTVFSDRGTYRGTIMPLKASGRHAVPRHSRHRVRRLPERGGSPPACSRARRPCRRARVPGRSSEACGRGS